MLEQEVVVTVEEGWKQKPLLGSDIKEIVCKHLGINRSVMTSPTRTKDWVKARQLAMYLIRRLTYYSYPQIGKMFGDRDHTTVLWACRVAGERYRTDPEYQDLVETLTQKIMAETGARPIETRLPVKVTVFLSNETGILN
jgi:chromosomal replication initiation ATPase DnaA